MSAPANTADSSLSPAGREVTWLRVATVWMPAFAGAMCLLLEICNQQKFPNVYRFAYQQPANAIFNYILVLLVGWLFVGLAGRPLIGIGLAAMPLFLLGIANRVKKNLLFDPVFPDDLELLRDFFAIGVDFTTTWQLLMVPLAVSMPVVGWMLDRKGTLPPLGWLKRIAIIVPCAAALGAVAWSPGTRVGSALEAAGVSTEVPRSREGYWKSGLALGFTMNIRADEQRIRMEIPYTAQNVKQVSNELLHDAKPATHPSAQEIKGITDTMLASSGPPSHPDELPHVIVLHAESLFRVQDVPGLKFTQNPTPTIEKLWKASGKPLTLVGKYGGGSIYSEFEATTGFSTLVFPVPFDNPSALVLPKARPVPSLAWLFRSMGYHTVALTCYPRYMWNVDRIYPKLGYQRHIAREDFGPNDYEDRYIADSKTYGKLIEVLKSADRPTFVFAANMGSHGIYTDVAKEITDVQVIRENPVDDPEELDGYVRAIARLDRALTTLFAELQHLKRPVVVMLYGDHLPAIPEVQRILYPKSEQNNPEAKARIFTTMAFVWTSRGTVSLAEATPARRGIFLFTPWLLRECGITHPFYTAFLEQVNRQIPGIGNGLYIGADGKVTAEVPESGRRTLEMLKTLEYDVLYGERYALDAVFPEFKRESEKAGAAK